MYLNSALSFTALIPGLCTLHRTSTQHVPHMHCLRRILGISWHGRVSKKETFWHIQECPACSSCLARGDWDGMVHWLQTSRKTTSPMKGVKGCSETGYKGLRHQPKRWWGSGHRSQQLESSRVTTVTELKCRTLQLQSALSLKKSNLPWDDLYWMMPSIRYAAVVPRQRKSYSASRVLFAR